MDWNLKVNNSWTGGQKKNLQKMLNTFGFTDVTGNTLKEDGIIGPKTTSAIQKLNRYQSDSRTPSSETRETQKQLNDFGFKDASGKALKEDGVWGPKTDAANNDFENNFLDGVTGGKNTAKTVQKGIYPSLPQITQKDVESVITPKAATVYDPMASQKNPDGTWNLTPKILTNFRGPRTQVAAPGTWSGSGGTTLNDRAFLEKAKAAQDMTRRINEGRTQFGYQETGGAQGQATTSRKSDTSNKNAIIKADNDEVKYEPNNGNTPFIGRGQLLKEGSFTVDFVEEKNRKEALDTVGVLNTFLDYKLAPIFNAIKNAARVSFESSQKELTIQDKRNEEIGKSSEDVSKLYTSADILDVATEIFKVIPAAQIAAAFTWPGEYVTKLIAENTDNNKTDDASKKYTGYDKQGDRINKIYQESIDLSYSNDGIFGESNIESSKIVYEYHIVDGIRRILSITVNGHQVYNDYQNQ